jgi:transaldolase
VDRLRRLFEEQGQSPWLDNLRRHYLTSGQLASLRDGGIRGLTSNPTIFQNAIVASTDYDDQFRALAATDASVVDAYWALVLHDIVGALDVFAPVYEASGGTDGFVSVEVDPALAYDTAATVDAARALHRAIDRPNLLVKVPATVEGVAAVRTLVGEGLNINVTLIFSLDRYMSVMDAYLEGLEAYAAAHPHARLDGIAGVASFFISRVDTEIDRRLDALGTDAARTLRGKAAIAQGKLAYQAFRSAFSGPRWETLAGRGARVQRPLWASTSTKDPAYPDTLYVDELIGPETVNTLPEATLRAFADHGTLARTIDRDVDAAERVWAGLGDVGVDVGDVAAQLEREGVAAFQKSFGELLDALGAKANGWRSADGPAS